MRIVTLMENTACREDLTAEHGLSLYIETGERRILFDAGQSGAFADNAEKLGVDLTKVDFAVLSHGHYDHGGGLKRFLKINPAAAVYVSASAFGEHYNAAQKYIGLDPGLRDCGRVIPVEEALTLAPGLRLCSWLAPDDPIRPFGLLRREGDALLPEDFRHEQYLLVEENGKRILFSGCSHRGILNIVRQFRPDVLVGGFHFMKLDPASEELEQAAQVLKGYPCVYYTGHCTGEAQFARLKERLGKQLHKLSAGMAVEV